MRAFVAIFIVAKTSIILEKTKIIFCVQTYSETNTVHRLYCWMNRYSKYPKSKVDVNWHKNWVYCTYISSIRKQTLCEAHPYKELFESFSSLSTSLHHLEKQGETIYDQFCQASMSVVVLGKSFDSLFSSQDLKWNEIDYWTIP